MDVEILCIGDALVDMFLALTNADEHTHIDQQKREICFIAGAKIPIENCQFLLGGNACNVSVGLSRLGVNVSLAAEMGDDEFSKKIITGLEREKVDHSLIKISEGSETSFAIDLTFMRDRTIFSRHVKRAHDIIFENSKFSWIFLTSMGEEWKPLYEKVFEYVKAKNIKLAFNPGSRQLKAGVNSFRNILSVSEIVFINREEAEDFVYGTDQNIADDKKNPENLLREVKKMEPKIVSITDGDKGSYTIDQEGNIFFQEAFPTTFLQKTGVGDAYASAFMAGLIQGKNIQESMRDGALNASNVIQHIGAQTGLLTKEQLMQKIATI